MTSVGVVAAVIYGADESIEASAGQLGGVDVISGVGGSAITTIVGELNSVDVDVGKVVSLIVFKFELLSTAMADGEVAPCPAGVVSTAAFGDLLALRFFILDFAML